LKGGKEKRAAAEHLSENLERDNFEKSAYLDLEED